MCAASAGYSVLIHNAIVIMLLYNLNNYYYYNITYPDF